MSTGLINRDSTAYSSSMAEGQLILADKKGTITYICGLCLNITPPKQTEPSRIGFWHWVTDPEHPNARPPVKICLDCGENEFADPCNEVTGKHRLYYAVSMAVPLCGTCQLKAAEHKAPWGIDITKVMPKAKAWFLGMGYWRSPKRPNPECKLKAIGELKLKELGYALRS